MILSRFILYNFFIVLFVLSGLSFTGSDPVSALNEPRLLSVDDFQSELVWDLNDPGAYIINHVEFEDGAVKLDSSEEAIEYSKRADFESGQMENLEYIDGAGLVLGEKELSSYLNVETEQEKFYDIHSKSSGYQTFELEEKIALGKIRFFCTVDGTINEEELIVSIETEKGMVLDSVLIPPENFGELLVEVNVKLRATVEAEEKYMLTFKSNASTGIYRIMGGNSTYSDGSFVKVTESENESEIRSEENEFKEEDIDFEIFAVEFEESGSYKSRVIDLGETVYWSGLEWAGEVFETFQDIQVFLRSSNDSAVPSNDGSWTDWKFILGKYNTEIDFDSSSSKYIQYKVTLNTTESLQSPELHKIIIYFEEFKETGYFETDDFAVSNETRWWNFTADMQSNGQKVDFFYSTDSGETWNEVQGSDLVLDTGINSTGLRIKAVLKTEQPLITPVLESFSISISEIEQRPNDNEKPLNPDLIESPEDESPLLSPVAMSTIGISAGLLGILGIGLGTETGKYSIVKYLLFLIVPLYHKVNKDKVLDHYVRKQIFKFVEANPGTNYTEIMNNVGIKNGVLVHHLNTLEREEMIKSTNDGAYYKRFYPIGMQLPKKEIDSLSWFQLGIFNLIRTNPGITPKKISEELGKSKQVINYHLNLLKEASLIKSEGQGKHTILYVTFEEQMQG